MSRIDRLADLEQAMQVVAVREIADIIDVSDKTDLRDREGVKDMMELKKNAAQTMLLMQRIGQYVDAKRGKTPFGAVDNRLPESVEKEAEQRVVNAIERFRARK